MSKPDLIPVTLSALSALIIELILEGSLLNNKNCTKNFEHANAVFTYGYVLSRKGL